MTTATGPVSHHAPAAGLTGFVGARCGPKGVA
jgi:hypothetical protein